MAAGAYEGLARDGGAQRPGPNSCRRRLVPLEGMWRMAAPNGPGPPARGTGSPAQKAVGAYGLPVGDGMPQ